MSVELSMFKALCYIKGNTVLYIKFMELNILRNYLNTI